MQRDWMRLLLLLLTLPLVELPVNQKAWALRQPRGPHTSLSRGPLGCPSLPRSRSFLSDSSCGSSSSAATREAAPETAPAAAAAAEQVTVFVVLLAGGVGRRFGSPQPKQFLPLLQGADAVSVSAAKLLCLRSRSCSSDSSSNSSSNSECSSATHDGPEGFVVVAAPEHRHRLSPLLQRLQQQQQQVCDVFFASPGAERWESVWQGLEAICLRLLKQHQQQQSHGQHQQQQKQQQRQGRGGETSPAARKQRALYYLQALQLQQKQQQPLQHQRLLQQQQLQQKPHPLGKGLLHQQQRWQDGVYIVIHDSARPCVPVAAANAVVAAAATSGAAVLCAAATDTIKLGTLENGVYRHLPRSETLIAQTPQVIRLDLLLQAYAELFALQQEQQQLLLLQQQQQQSEQQQRGQQERLQYISSLLEAITDDVSLLQLLPSAAAGTVAAGAAADPAAAGESVAAATVTRAAVAAARPALAAVLLNGSGGNPKITKPYDLSVAAALLQQEAETIEAAPWLRLLGLRRSSSSSDEPPGSKV